MRNAGYLSRLQDAVMKCCYTPLLIFNLLCFGEIRPDQDLPFSERKVEIKKPNSMLSKMQLFALDLLDKVGKRMVPTLALSNEELCNDFE